MDRDEMIEDCIRACEGCGSREFPRRWDCESCIAAVDERIAAMADAEGDRIAAITRDISAST